MAPDFDRTPEDVIDAYLNSDIKKNKITPERAEKRKRKFIVTLNNTGYAMVRQAREMVAVGEAGRIVAVHASYIQDWLTRPIPALDVATAKGMILSGRAGTVLAMLISLNAGFSV